MASCEVARAADFGSNDRTCFARTHLGNLLHAGDTAVGFDVANANLVDPELEKAVHKVGGRVGGYVGGELLRAIGALDQPLIGSAL